MAKTTKEKDNTESSSFEKTIKELENRYGIGSVINGKTVSEELEVVSSGSIALNLATNCGGIPVGKLLEYHGMESSGKSSGVLHNIAEFQKIGRCVLCDSEQSFDRKYAEKIGVNVDELIILQPDCLEDAYNMMEALIRTGEIRLICFDSHTSSMPRRIVDGEVGEATIGLQARINSQALGKIKPLLKANRCTLIGISQIRKDIGCVSKDTEIFWTKL